MQMMTIYRAGAEPLIVRMADCLAGAVTETDTDLVNLCLRTKRPTLIGLDNQSTIIKPVEEGDDALSFEALYDNCLTLVDLQKMHRAGVNKPEDVPPDLYRAEVAVAIDGTCYLAVGLYAANIGDVRPRFRELWLHDVLFRETLYDKVIEAVERNLRAHGQLQYAIPESNQIDPAELPRTPGGPTWTFLEGP
jgi:hypothetical protein